MSVDISLPSTSAPFKTEFETSFLFRDDVSKCGEIFVTNDAEKWTFSCGYCQEITNDIGVFICHIRFGHMPELAQQQQMQQNQLNPKEDSDVFTIIDTSSQADTIEFMPTIENAGALASEEQVQEEETMASTEENSESNFFKVSKIVDITSLTQPEIDANEKLKEERPFKCNLCHHTFTNQPAYEIHVEKHKTHKFVCKVCGSFQRYKNELIEHIRTHTGEKPLTCTICDRRFAKRSALRIHKSSHEKGLKHACNVCDKKFCIKSDLKKHKYLHKNQTNFVCKICGFTVGNQAGLSSHMRVHI